MIRRVAGRWCRGSETPALASETPTGCRGRAKVSNEVSNYCGAYTGKTLNFRISGPGTFTDLDGVAGGAFMLDLGGANLLWTTVDNSYPGVPQLAYTTGHVQVGVEASGPRR